MIKNNVGIIGLGYWGKNILRNLIELELLHTACDSNPNILDERKKDFPNISITLDFKNVLSNPEIKAVVIATPATTHKDFITKALLSNKDVFVEKPLALSVQEGKELVQLAEQKQKILMVGHILHYHPAVNKLKELLHAGELGRIQYIYSNRLNMGKLRIEENILWSFAPHDISLILSLVGEKPTKVDCIGEAFLNEEIADITLTSLTFPNKVKAHIFVSWLHPFKEQKLVVVGSKSMAVFDDISAEKLFIYPHTIEWKDGKIPIAHKAEHFCPPIDNKEPLMEELIHFSECVSKRTQPKTDGKEGLKVLEILEMAEHRLKEDKKNEHKS